MNNILIVFAIVFTFNNSVFALKDQLRYLGHGMRKTESLDHREIDLLKKKYMHHEVLKYAFAIMEGADLAIAHDTNHFLKSIKKRQFYVDKKKLCDLMEQEKKSIKKAFHYFDPKNDQKTLYGPLIEVFSILANQPLTKIYKDKYGIDHAIALIQSHGDYLIRGEIPEALKNATGNEAIYLRIALFYIDVYKRKQMGLKDVNFTHLKSFYSTSYFGHKKELKNLLMQTSFYHNGRIYTPSNGYIKNADVYSDVSACYFNQHLNVKKSLMRPMIFSDCSGFIQSVARNFHKNNETLQNKRQMSYHLAAVYDYLANKKLRSPMNKFYNVEGRSRNLTFSEKNRMTTFRHTIEKLSSVYEPVINSIKTIQPGDIIIQRGPGEGHVMMAVEQSAADPYLITIIELTSGKGNGFNWTRKRLRKLDEEGKFHRVLRIKMSQNQMKFETNCREAVLK